MVLVSLSFIFRTLFPSVQFIIRVFFLFAEFISGCAKTGSGAGPDDWQDAMHLASESQAGISHSTTDISCHGTGPLVSSPRSWQESCCNQSKPVAPGQPPPVTAYQLALNVIQGPIYITRQDYRGVAWPVSITGKIHPSPESLPGGLCGDWCIHL